MEEKDEKKFEIEGQLEDNEDDHLEEDFEEEYEEESRGPWLYLLLVFFIILFLSAASLLVYFQFYQGKIEGKHKFEFSLEKRTTSAMADQGLMDKISFLKAQIDSFESGAILRDSSQTGFTPAFDKSADETMPTTPMGGEKYHVQIGAYRNFPFKNYGSRDIIFRIEKMEGLNKIVIGSFDSFEDACAFRKDLMTLGVSDAFILKTENGSRVNFDRYCP